MQVDPMKPKLKPPGTKRLRLKCDILLSTSAFKFNLRRYTEVSSTIEFAAYDASYEAKVVGRCRLTVSKPVLKAPMVSALETTIS